MTDRPTLPASLVRSDWNATIYIEGAGDCERRLEVTPTIAGWDYLSFRTYTFRAGQVIDGESASDEMSMVLLSGRVTIEIAGSGGSETWECDGRETVFDGAPCAIYLPPGHTYKTTVHADADCAYGRAPAEGRLIPHLIRPQETTTTTTRTGGKVTRILSPGDTEHLLCQERVIEPGKWAGIPPHRHKIQNPPDEVGGYLEEVSYYRTDPVDGWGVQVLGTADDGEAFMVRHGDAVIVRGEAHPVVAGPETRLYALTYIAGPTPAWPAE
jgi:5-deoxy-glucuronate isomerase